jgi:hypothetical protein
MVNKDLGIRMLSRLEKKEGLMIKSPKLIFLTATLSILVALSTHAQITNVLIFKTSFPFYAGNAKMPAGEYRVSQPDENFALLIESVSGSHSAFVDFAPTTSEQPHPQSDVTFNKYGGVDFLNMLWVQGQNYGMQVLPTKHEESLAKTATVQKHTVPIKSSK